jgi:hypothetical protein
MTIRARNTVRKLRKGDLAHSKGIATKRGNSATDTSLKWSGGDQLYSTEHLIQVSISLTLEELSESISPLLSLKMWSEELEYSSRQY